MSTIQPTDTQVAQRTNEIVAVTKIIRDALSDSYLEIEASITVEPVKAIEHIAKAVKASLAKELPTAEYQIVVSVDENHTATVVAEKGNTKITLRATRRVLAGTPRLTVTG